MHEKRNADLWWEGLLRILFGLMMFAMALLLMVVALLLFAVSAKAYEIPEGSYRWPGEKITYYASGPATNAIVTAANSWNSKHVGIRFQRVQKKHRAQVTFVFTAYDTCDIKLVPVGYSYNWNSRRIRYERGTTVAELTRPCLGETYWLPLLAARSFGFVLGLGASERHCSVMNFWFTDESTANARPRKCPKRAPGYYVTHPVQEDEARGARLIYSRPFVRPPTDDSREGEDPNRRLREEEARYREEMLS